MDDKDVAKAVNAELNRSDTFLDIRISYERALAYDYYYGREFGNEMEGRSRVISADVAQAVDSAVPAIMEVFISGDQAVEFTPRNAEDVQASEQATVGANYVFFTQNNGYALAHDFIKDGLLQKTGAFKWKWDTSVVMSEKRYQGLTDGEMQILSTNPDCDIIEHSEYPDPNWKPPMMGMGMPPGMPQPPMPAPPPGMPPQMPPGAPPQPQMPPMQPPTLHDVTTRYKKESGKVKIAVPAPEEIQISPDSTTLDVMDMPFIAHTPLLTESDLVQMKIPQSVIDTLPKGDEDPLQLERVARHDRTDSSSALLDQGDDSNGKFYRYNECYIKLDVDDDGIAELRKICLVGDTILQNEPVDHIPIALWTPKVMPHEVVGISLADDVMDLQLLKSTIWRQMMDNLYLSNAPRMFVQGDVNLDDLLTVKPGGAIRGEAGSSLMPIEVPFTASAGYQMLEYSDQEKDARVGFSAVGPGLDPNSINKTATYVRQMTEQTNARAKLIARNAAEFGFKPLFKGILYLLSKHQQQPLLVRLNNQFTPIDPETWNKEYDMTCNVGLGIGSKDQQLLHLQALGRDLQTIAQSPFASQLLDAEKIYNYVEKKANLAGFKDVSVFINKPPVGPDGRPIPPPQQPNPMIQAEQIKAQAAGQTAQVKAQADMAINQAKSQAEAQVEQNRISMQAQLELERTKQQLILEDVKHSREQQNALTIANIDAQNAYAIAQLNAEAKIVAAQVAAKQAADAATQAADAQTARDLGA